MATQQDMIDCFLKFNRTRICMRGKYITDGDIQYICAKSNCANISSIILSNNCGLLTSIPNTITHIGVLYFSRMKWDRLTHLDLSQNKIGDKGCKYLTQMHMPNIEHIQLDSNSIGDGGLLHLSKGQWRKIATMSVQNKGYGRGFYDLMRLMGCKYLMKANWRNLSRLQIISYNLTYESAITVLLCEFPQISFIDLKCYSEHMMTSKLTIIEQMVKDRFPLIEMKI